MSIKDRQLQDTENTILMEELRAGRYPELSDMQQKIAAQFKDKPLGLPRFQLYQMVNGEISDPDQYNRMTATMQTDLLTGFEEISDLQNQMMGLADYYETERGKINKAIKKMESRMQDILKKSTIPTGSYVFTQLFQDFLQVEFDGDDSRNIPATNAFIDLKNGWATLDKVKTGITRYDISDASIDVGISGVPLSTETDSDASNLLNDTVNTAWRYIVTCSTSDPVTVSLPVYFAVPLAVTTISFVAESPASTDVTLSTSTDGKTFIPKETKTAKAGEIVTWTFPLEQLVAIQLDLLKNGPDSTDQTEQVFYFGGSRLLVQRELYQTSGTFVSKPFPIQNFIIDSVQVMPTEIKQPGTNIRYYVGIDDPERDYVEWIETDTTGAVDYDAYGDYTAYIDENTASYGTLLTQKYGNSFYELMDVGQDNITPVSGTSSLYIGHEMWQLDTMTVSAAPSGLTGPKDWNALAGAYLTQFVGIESMIEGNKINLSPGKLNRLSVFFYSDTDRMPFRQTFQMDSSVNLSVYLNNTMLNGVQVTGGTDYVYNVKQGLNQLIIYAYSATAASIAANIGLSQISSWVRASNSPLTEVSSDYLLNNTSMKDYGKFAYQGTSLMVNYNPASFDLYGKGVRYALTCQYPKESPKDVGVRIMAVFSRSQAAEDVSAQLTQCQLVVK